MKIMNRKNRNLKYIRTKNNLRKGGLICTFQKLPREEKYRNQLIDESNSISKKYKLPIKLHSLEVGLVGDDFYNDLNTYRLNYKVYYNE